MKHQHDHGADHSSFGDPTAGDGFCGRNRIKYRVIPEAAGGQIWMLPTSPALPRDARDPTPPLYLPLPPPRSPSTLPSPLLPLLTRGFASRHPFLPGFGGRAGRGVLDSAGGSPWEGAPWPLQLCRWGSCSYCFLCSGFSATRCLYGGKL